MKSSKLVPVHFSSRYYDFKRSKWVFGKASDQAIELLLARKIYWQTRLKNEKAWLGDPTEALYLETSTEHCMEVARNLESQGAIQLEGDSASATPSLLAQGAKFESDMRAALQELEEKHAFERG